MTLQMRKSNLLIWGLTLLHLTSYHRSAEGLIGYDCNGATLNITTLSLLEVGECNIPQQEVNEVEVHIQLLQINQYASVHVKQCKVEIYRVIRRCGMWSHGMDVPNGEYSYIESISRDVCTDIYRYGKLKVGQTEVDVILANQTTNRPVSIAGTLTGNSDCQGTTYSDPYGTWEKVYVQGSVKITLRDYRADVDVDTNKVLLRSGIKCELDKGRCIDIDGGDTYWEPFPEDSCHSKRYGVLFEGQATRTTDRNTQFKQTIYSLTKGDVVFALTAKEHTSICGYTLIRTEHPKLLIVETEKGNPFITKEQIAVSNLDLFSYVNSKFVYVEKHIRTQMKQMYRNILIQRCNLERQVLENTIGLAKQSPDEFAYNIMKGPGYMAVLAGEVAHLVKCIPIEVRIRETIECYTQLPVEVGNVSYHLTPRTHILKKTGSQVTCNKLVPAMYKISGEWYSLEPRPTQSPPPTVLKPLTEHTWTYKNPQALATSGIYTQKDLDDLRDHIMFPAERPAILNSVARGIAGQPTITQGGSIANLLDDQAINKIIESTWEKSWGYFSTFGNISAGLIGIVVLIRGIKLIIDTIIHGYALHTVYGWSLYLLGAIWDSVTHLLLHLGRQPPKPKKDDDDKNNGGGSEKPLLPKELPVSQPVDGWKEERKCTTFKPLEFGFDPRIYDLQHNFVPETSNYSHTLPVRIHHRDSLPPHLNPVYETGIPMPPPINYTWSTNENTNQPESIYKNPRAGIRKYRPVSVDNEMEFKEISSVCKREEASTITKLEDNAPDTLKRKVEITSPTLYPTLEKVKRATIKTPIVERKQKQTFLSLARQTDD